MPDPAVAEGILYRVSPAVHNDALNALFAAAWPAHAETDFAPIHRQSLVYLCAYDAGKLVGYVNLASDGGIHAFLLDTTVHPDWQRRGIGRKLVEHATAAARQRGIVWLHVDFEPHLQHFYSQCGFRPTAAGLIHLPSA